MKNHKKIFSVLAILTKIKVSLNLSRAEEIFVNHQMSWVVIRRSLLASLSQTNSYLSEPNFVYCNFSWHNRESENYQSRLDKIGTNLKRIRTQMMRLITINCSNGKYRFEIVNGPHQFGLLWDIWRLVLESEVQALKLLFQWITDYLLNTVVEASRNAISLI